MALTFTHLASWLWSGQQKRPIISNGSSPNSSTDSNQWELDNLKSPLASGANVASSSRRLMRKWRNREERKTDREYDVVLVPPDNGCVSDSESDASDYSIGWLEPHSSEFQSDDDEDNSFAVLVPCYERRESDLLENPKNNMLGAVVNIPDESKKYMEQWLSSLQKTADTPDC